MRAIRRLRHSRQLIEDTFQKPGKQQAAHDDRSRNQRAANCGFHTQSMIGTMQKRLCVLFATQVDNSFSTRISETSACTRLPGKSAHTAREQTLVESSLTPLAPLHIVHTSGGGGGGGGATWRHLLTHWLPPQTPQRRCFTPRSL